MQRFKYLQKRNAWFRHAQKIPILLVMTVFANVAQSQESSWTYTHIPDALTGTEETGAFLKSANSIGSERMTLILSRSADAGIVIGLSLSQEQFFCRAEGV